MGLTKKATVNSDLQQTVIAALKTQPFELESLKTVMRNILTKCSCHDLQRENSYHLFYYGLFIVACGASNVWSNLEAGHGRYDIRIAFRELNRLIIFEFKQSKSECDLENDAKEGLKQIQDKEYHKDQQYVGWTCYAIGVSFFKKHMSELKCELLKV